MTYDPDKHTPHNQRANHRQINFDDDDFAGEAPAGNNRPTPRDNYGRRDRDWADDLATRADGRLSDDYDEPRHTPERRSYRAATTDDAGYDPQEEYSADDYDTPRQRHAPRRPIRREYYNEEDDDEAMENKKPRSFVKKHPVLMNLVYAIAAAGLLLWVMMWFLDFWTFHGEERVVPDVKGQTYASAAGNIDISGLRAEISDSVFDSYSRPGTVVEQIPVPGARIKRGGTVYLTIVAFTPKLVTVPEFYNVSARQARSMFEGIGIKDIREVQIVSEYPGLVLGAKFNGVALQPGAKIPVSAVVTIEVGTGYELDAFGTDTDSTTTAISEPEELNIE